jgi:hypothetical protein
MARLLVAKICGAKRVSRSDGEALRHRMEEHWDDAEPMVLDFDGVVIASVSFFDESFGVLALRYRLRHPKARIRFDSGSRDRIGVGGQAQETRVGDGTSARASRDYGRGCSMSDLRMPRQKVSVAVTVLPDPSAATNTISSDPWSA